MILVGNQRGGAKDLALHLLREDNDHVRVHELRGFASDNLVSCLNEAYAVSLGTKCKQFLFSLSINPPLDKEITTEDFEKTIDRAEAELGLTGQARAIVFHEKQGPGGTRRHAHAVWSRIDVEQMKAIQLSHTRRKLVALTREQFLEREWLMPRGLMVSEERKRNFSFAEWQQAKRAQVDAAATKAAIQDCWAVSDSRGAFTQALATRGFKLARGDRRGFVAVDARGEPYAISRWVGLRSKELKAKLGEPDDKMASVDQCKREFATEIAQRLETLRGYENRRATVDDSRAARVRETIVARQCADRAAQDDEIRLGSEREAAMRQSRFRSGILGFVDRVTGRYARVRNETIREAVEASRRDRAQIDALVFAQMKERQGHEQRAREATRLVADRQQELDADIARVQAILGAPKSPAPEFARSAHGFAADIPESDADRQVRKENFVLERQRQDMDQALHRVRVPHRER